MSVPKYFILHSSDPSYAHHEVRKENVDRYVNDLDCAVIDPAYWKNDWEGVKNFYSFFQIPFKFPFTMGWPKRAYEDSTKGKYSYWATSILFAKYAYEIHRETNLVRVEDDFAILQQFEEQYSKWDFKYKEIKALTWPGLLHIYNDISAENFIRSIFLHGVKVPYDFWVHGKNGNNNYCKIASIMSLKGLPKGKYAICQPNIAGDIKGPNSEVAVDLPFPSTENPGKFNHKKYFSWFTAFGSEELNNDSNTKAAEHKIKADKMASAFLDYPLFNPNDPYNSSNFDYPSLLKSIPKNNELP